MPDQKNIQLIYEQNENKLAFPYWAKIWPAAFVLTEFIAENPKWFSNKKVLELAAGIGLPSLFVSHFASSVICSDYNEEAILFIQENISLNKIGNMSSAFIDWNQMPDGLEWEVLLMSDINYNPNDFEVLLALMIRFIAMGKIILLSTPQRLAGKSFIEALLPYCLLNEERMFKKEAINLLVLKK